MFFIYEYTFFFLYTYSFILTRITDTVLIGWYILFLTHFMTTVYFFVTTLYRITEPTFFVLIAGFVLTLTALFIVILHFQTLNKPDPSVNNSKTRLFIPRDKQLILDEMNIYLIANICFLFIVFFAFKSRNNKYILPMFINRRSENTITTIQFVNPANYSMFLEYMIPWVVGGSHLATLALSSYVLFLAVEFKK